MREIDVSDPNSLSLEDRLYLQDRGQLPEGAEPVTPEEYWGLQQKTTLVATATGSELVPEDKVEEFTNGDTDTEDGELEVEDYNDLTVEDLREELSARNLPTDGKKADLVARLEKDDEAGA